MKRGRKFTALQLLKNNVDEVLELREDGLIYEDIAKIYNVSKNTVCRFFSSVDTEVKRGKRKIAVEKYKSNLKPLLTQKWNGELRV